MRTKIEMLDAMSHVTGFWADDSPTSREGTTADGTPTANASRGRMSTLPTVTYPSGASGSGTPCFSGKSLASGGSSPVLTARANA